VAKLEERATYDHRDVAFGTNHWTDDTIAPHGYRAIESFRLEGTTPVWTFAVGDALVEKSVTMRRDANATDVGYRLVRATAPLTLDVRFLAADRDMHGTMHANDDATAHAVGAGVRVVSRAEGTPITIAVDRGTLVPAAQWYRAMVLPRENERGLDDREDVFHAATCTVTLAPGDSVTVTMSLACDDVSPAAADAAADVDDTLLATARAALAPDGGELPAWIVQLVRAAEQFVVRRPVVDDPDAMTVIAGYPWFGDWGRDTMIALPGLALATGRFALAATILRTFARFVDGGMLPNFFPNDGETPEYNTVDAALWFIEAVRAYDATANEPTLARDLFAIVQTILEAYATGTRYGIGIDPHDGLLRAGVPGVQLTWMAKVDTWVVTPRIGKPVEVNALYYNALRAAQGFAERFADRETTERYRTAADRVRSSFDRFWNPATGGLFDVLDGPAGDDASIRPNQLFAVSLHASPLAADRQRAVVALCARDLLTSHGLRSLAPSDPQYRGTYAGTVRDRDGAYHQGTVWCWLVGPFVEASLRVGVSSASVASYLAPFAELISAYGVGSLPEIADGDAPFVPNGCPAQAWSVAETLRAWALLAADARHRAGERR
jgi:predicted glycogen debranching enzyme